MRRTTPGTMAGSNFGAWFDNLKKEEAAKENGEDIEEGEGLLGGLGIGKLKLPAGAPSWMQQGLENVQNNVKNPKDTFNGFIANVRGDQQNKSGPARAGAAAAQVRRLLHAGQPLLHGRLRRAQGSKCTSEKYDHKRTIAFFNSVCWVNAHDSLRMYRHEKLYFCSAFLSSSNYCSHVVHGDFHTWRVCWDETFLQCHCANSKIHHLSLFEGLFQVLPVMLPCSEQMNPEKGLMAMCCWKT
mmetsp:Transcript_27130/g.44746  ORF Transcript_27130/g.44746 Transcript_27130/m.44746 type:complete len:241 (+) Transcript_27130:105-827(+)